MIVRSLIKADAIRVSGGDAKLTELLHVFGVLQFQLAIMKLRERAAVMEEAFGTGLEWEQKAKYLEDLLGSKKNDATKEGEAAVHQNTVDQEVYRGSLGESRLGVDHANKSECTETEPQAAYRHADRD
jgi:hypothetical protein